MSQGLTTPMCPGLPDADQGVPGRGVRSGRIGITTWMDAPLLMLSMSLLSLSVFSGLLVSAYHLVILLAVGGSVLYATSANGSTTERISQRRVALFLVVLLNIYLISLTNGLPGSVLYGQALMGLGSLMGLAVFVLWAIRVVRLRTFRIISSPIDLAVLLLFLLTSACFLGLYVLFYLNGLPFQAKPDVLWVVSLTTLLYYILRDLLHSESAIKRTLRLSLFPLTAVCLSASISLWLTW